MNTRTKRNVVCAALLVAAVTAVQPAQAYPLVDPGFELNPLTSYVNVLTNFTTYQGVWGAENGTIVTTENGVTPPEGVKMLRMDDDGLVATQGFQVLDASAFAGPIDSGLATFSFSARFNVDQFVPAAVSSVHVQFFSAANYGSQIGVGTNNSLSLDGLATTWETASVGGAVPVNTRWMLVQVAYSNASLLGTDGAIHPGYVDAAQFRVVPEPATLGLLVLGAVSMWMRRR